MLGLLLPWCLCYCHGTSVTAMVPRPGRWVEGGERARLVVGGGEGQAGGGGGRGCCSWYNGTALHTGSCGDCR